MAGVLSETLDSGLSSVASGGYDNDGREVERMDDLDESDSSDETVDQAVNPPKTDTFVQVGSGTNTIVYKATYNIVIDKDALGPENHGGPVHVHIHPGSHISTVSESTNGVEVKITIINESPAEVAAYTETHREGYITRVLNFFRNLITRIRFSSIILQISPRTPEDLCFMLESGINSYVLDLLQKPEVISKIKGDKAMVQIELTIPEGVLKASGLSPDDLQALQVRREIIVDPMSSLTSGTVSTPAAKEIHLVIIGEVGSGKSSLGNAIVGKDVFPTFLSGSGITSTVQTETIVRHGRVIHVTDTPGVDRGEFSGKSKLIEGLGSLLHSCKGDAIFILTHKLGNDKRPKIDAASQFYNIYLGQMFVKNLIVVFTAKEFLKEIGLSLHDCIKLSPDLGQFSEVVDNRIAAIEKRAPEKEKEQDIENILDTVVKLADDADRPTFPPMILDRAACLTRENTDELARAFELDRKKKEEAAIEGVVVQNVMSRGAKAVEGGKESILPLGIEIVSKDLRRIGSDLESEKRREQSEATSDKCIIS